ncbi:uncharacterized protein LOC112576527 isoform X3 [Pomacea canaliculata]|uniref:uncharacterized protein LOC112576527 isoform X3 n=1 Tax=Pomacea canaliculata TaxID=400727 RepID=UPI000D726FBA|nr:uncharacterized protein LOC112576527 isoform X3 [Pomacea canaliculata]
MASPPPRPSVIRHRFGARAPVLQSFLDDEPSLSRTLEHSDFPYRGQRHTSPPSKILAGYRPSSPLRHTLAPAPVSTLKESKYLGRPRASLHPRPSPYASTDLNFDKSELPRYDLVYVDHEPGAKPFRRRPRVLGSSRRPAGNYYERLLRKRGKRRGKFGPYYDVESIEGSDLTDVLSDTGSLSDLDASYGTYDSSVTPSYTFQDYPLSSSPSSAYYVDQDTEYVPYGPSRHLETTGLLEVSSYNGNDDENEECSDTASLPSPMNDLSLSTYLPNSVVSSALSRSPYRAVVPYTSSFLDNCLDVMPSSSPSQKLLDSLVQTAVARARSAVDALALPDYHGASLVLSVEGAGKMADGKIVDFTYTPPPIPLFGRAPRLDDRIMGLSLKRKDVLRPVDDFLAGYVKRMESLRSQLYGRQDNDKDKDKHPRYGLTAAETPSRQYSTPSYSTYKPYTSSHTYVPVRHLSSQRTEHVPVTSYRRDLDDGRSHRMDVFPLSVIKPRIAESTPKAITLPGAVTKDGSPVQLSVLDRINIKAAIIASKLEPDPIKRRRPRSQFAADKLRNMRKEAQESVYTGTASAGMTASTPPLPRLTERKAIRTEEGFSKPKNILSWQYRVESRIPPNDLLYQPSSFIRIREQVRNAQERMDRHRQLLDRYLPDSEDTGDIAAKVLRKTSELEKRNASYRAGGGADSTTATVKNPALYARK